LALTSNESASAWRSLSHLNIASVLRLSLLAQRRARRNRGRGPIGALTVGHLAKRRRGIRIGSCPTRRRRRRLIKQRARCELRGAIARRGLAVSSAVSYAAGWRGRSGRGAALGRSGASGRATRSASLGRPRATAGGRRHLGMCYFGDVFLESNIDCDDGLVETQGQNGRRWASGLLEGQFEI